MKIFDEPEHTRRTFVKTVSYVAPVILTLKATPALADHPSHQPKPGEHPPTTLHVSTGPL